MRTTPLDEWTHDELTWLERRIISIQDAVGYHFPWCDALIPDQHQPCSCGMDAMRVNRVAILNLRAYGTVAPQEPQPSPQETA